MTNHPPDAGRDGPAPEVTPPPAYLVPFLGWIAGIVGATVAIVLLLRRLVRGR